MATRKRRRVFRLAAAAACVSVLAACGGCNALRGLTRDIDRVSSAGKAFVDELSRDGPSARDYTP